MSKKKETTIRVLCINCGNNYCHHLVLYEFKRSHPDEDGNWLGETVQQLVQCRGCDSVKYREYDITIDNCDEDGVLLPFNEMMFPSIVSTPCTRELAEFATYSATGSTVPAPVMKMYRETIYAINAKATTLAGGGLRATVEAICLAQGITTGTLQNKIESLATQGLLTPTQAELLHEERYLGNAALHELATPSHHEIEDGLQIVEGLISTIYVLPTKAKRLREAREQKKQKKGHAKATPSTKGGTKKS